MSRALERLRASLGDELLIRRNNDYELTPRAEQLRVRLQDILPELDSAIQGERFNPSQSREHFRVVSTAYASIVLVPQIVSRVNALAPLAVFDVEPWRDGSAADIDAGHSDLAIVGIDQTAAFEVETILEDKLVCIVDRNHPLCGEPLTLERYVRYPHVAIALERGGQPWIDRPLQQRGLARHIAFRSWCHTSAALALVDSPMIFTAGRRWWQRFERKDQYAVLVAPQEFEQFRYGMAWHRRKTSNAAHAWLRDIVRSVAAAL